MAAVGGVLLAAGRSSRFRGPGPKQLAAIDGVPLVRLVAERALASRLHELVVVTGSHGAEVTRALDGLAVQVVDNPDYREGQSTSMRRGLSAISPACDAALFLACDQPRLSTDLIDRLIERFESTGAPIVQPVAGGRRGSPVLFARELFPELMQVEGDTGGRAILPGHVGEIDSVELDDDRELRDFDTVEELERLG